MRGSRQQWRTLGCRHQVDTSAGGGPRVANAPQVSLSPPLPRIPHSPGTEGTEDPAATPQHPPRRRSQGHSCGAIADAHRPVPSRHQRINKLHRGAPTPAPCVAGGPSPGARRSPEPGARSEPHSLARREPRPSARPLPGPAPGARTRRRRLGAEAGPGGRASLPGAEVSARGTGGAGAGGFISPGGGPPIDGARAVHCALRYGNAVPAGEGRGGARGAGVRGTRGCGPRGRARAPRGREGRCGEGASGKGADAGRTGGLQAGSRAAGAGGAGRREGAGEEGGAETEDEEAEAE